ncbi:DNA primase family protein [Saccharibacillus sacchari]|uniref:DNA primase family protein n=1 Tax=Saccharibacillus sacchari TaxID=456493 RepID=UPI0004B0C609|nr:phage/plasmid primase, P4 family [Saccharibacillus sacchari]
MMNFMNDNFQNSFPSLSDEGISIIKPVEDKKKSKKSDSTAEAPLFLEDNLKLEWPEYSQKVEKKNKKEVNHVKRNEKSKEKILRPVSRSPEKEKALSIRTSNHQLAEVLMQLHQFVVIEDALYYWDSSLQYFIDLMGDKIDAFIRQNIPEEFKRNINSNTNKEIFRWIKTKKHLQIKGDELLKRKEYVAFANCIIRIEDMKVLRHSPDYYFTSVINANYPINEFEDGETFEEFVYQITGGNQALYLRLQELFGYVLSEIRDVKVIPFLLGPKDSGKSIILKLLENLIGEDFFTSLSFENFSDASYLGHLFGKKLNACGEVSEIALNRLDVLKKISGGDYVMARFLYDQSFKFINKAALLFAGNHLPTIKGIDKSNAFSERLAIFPFNYPVPKEQQDIYLLDKLLKEKSYIVEWALQGLRRWSNNNHQFTTCEEIEELEEQYSQQNNPILTFIHKRCILHSDSRIYSSELYAAYKNYCNENGMAYETITSFNKEVKSLSTLKYSRFRQGERNDNGYTGISLRSEYELEEEMDYEDSDF